MRILKQLWSQMWEKKGMHCNCDVWIRHLKMVDIFEEIEVERKAEAKDKEREKEQKVEEEEGQEEQEEQDVVVVQQVDEETWW